MVEFNIDDEYLYDVSKPENMERTKNRLEIIKNLGMQLSCNYSFYINNVMSGLWIENVWNYPDDRFNDYIEWIKELVDNNRLNGQD